MTVIHAPAGYGKSTLLAQFVDDLEMPVCWLALDESDKDPAQFLRDLADCVTQVFQDVLESLSLPSYGVPDHRESWQERLAYLLSHIHREVPELFVLVLDDFHTVGENPEIVHLVDTLLTHLPDNIHLVLSSRTKPPLPSLPRLAVQRQVTKLTTSQLRFTVPEVKKFFETAYHKVISDEAATDVVEKMGGWIAGIVLMAESESFDGRVQGEGEASGDLFEYLLREVFGQQPQELQRFLLDTSILTELEPELCDEVTSRSDSHHWLRYMWDRHLFLSSISSDSRVFKLHNLFRTFLLETLRQTAPDRLLALHRLAGEAFEKRGRVVEAVAYYVQARDFRRVTSVLEREFEDLFHQGYWHQLASAVDALPLHVLDEHPWLFLCRAWIAVDMGDPDQALRLCSRAEMIFREMDDIRGIARVLLAKSAALRQKGFLDEAVVMAQEALDSLPDDIAFRSAYVEALKHIGLSLYQKGNFAEAMEPLSRAAKFYETSGDTHNRSGVYNVLGQISATTGNLAEALTHLERARQGWSKLRNNSALAQVVNNIGVIYQMQGELELAQETLEEALRIAEATGSFRFQAYIIESLADVSRDRGEMGQAQQLYSQALDLAKKADQAPLVLRLLDSLARTYMLAGELDRAERMAQASLQPGILSTEYEEALWKRTLGDILCQKGRHQEANALLLEANAGLMGCNDKQGEAKALFSLARLYHRMRDFERAKQYLADLAGVLKVIGEDGFLVLEASYEIPLLEFALSSGISELHYYTLLHKAKGLQHNWAKPRGHAKQKSLPRIEAYALRPWRILCEGEEIPARLWESRKAVELLFLLLFMSRELRKEEAIEALWPEHPLEKGNSCFQSTVYRVRRALYKDAIVRRGDSYRLNPDGQWWLDAHEFTRLVEVAHAAGSDAEAAANFLEEAVRLHHQPFLADFDTLWSNETRAELQRKYVTALSQLTEYYTRMQRYDELVRACNRILEEDPYNEETVACLLRAYVALGKSQMAAEFYDSFKAKLREDLNEAPSDHLVSVYCQLVKAAPHRA
ncbi:MAG: tetratricopeptide repeat protein [Dehalococcoidia bacterium]